MCKFCLEEASFSALAASDSESGRVPIALRINSYVSDDLTITIHLTSSQKQIHLGVLPSECSGGYREGETPGPIPNPEAKTLIAHNTASFRCGNVGRRLALRFPLQNFTLYKLINNILNLPKNNSSFYLFHSKFPSYLDYFSHQYP